MTDIEIIEQKPITILDLKEKLDSKKSSGKELNFRANKVYAYLEEFLAGRKNSDVYKKISDLKIQKLKERYIIKIIDIMPEDQDSLKSIFVGESITLKPEELKQILDAVNS